MSKLVLMFHGKLKTINVRKKKIVQMRPLTAEIINNKTLCERIFGRGRTTGMIL